MSTRIELSWPSNDNGLSTESRFVQNSKATEYFLKSDITVHVKDTTTIFGCRTQVVVTQGDTQAEPFRFSEETPILYAWESERWFPLVPKVAAQKDIAEGVHLTITT